MIISITLAMIQTADAFNLGMLQKSLSANVSAGDTAAFRVLFWNADEIGYTLSINKINAPENWLIIIQPNNFLLNNSLKENIERIYLPGNKTTINAKASDIYITIPEKETVGVYQIVLNAIAGNEKNTGFSLFQERKIMFQVNVIKGSEQKINESGDNEPRRTVFIDTSSSIDNSDEMGTYSLNNHSGEIGVQYKNIPYVKVNEEQNKKPYLIIILLFVVIIFAWRIYKYD